MSVTPIQPFVGERVVGVSPGLERDVLSTWRRRLRMFTGRTLSAAALELEQTFRAGLLALHGQLFSPGIVEGLVAGFTPDGKSLEISPGLGLAASGELIATPQHQTIPIANLQGVAPGAGVLVLKPTEFKIIGNFDAGDSCDYDPSQDSFADWQLIDGAVAAFVPWPAATLGTIAEGPHARNLLAYAIFDAEARMGPQDTFPWEDAGLPLALVWFDANLKPEFIDRGAVVREGGTPRRRTPILVNSGHPALWQARLLQFGEQLAGFDFNTLDTGDGSAEFLALPPAGLLPPEAIDFTFSAQSGAAFRGRFFPAHFRLSASPIPLEQLDAAIERAAPLSPLNTGFPEAVEILIPVPQPVFEPELLMAEQVDPVFDRQLQDAIERRAEWLKHREIVRAGYSAINKDIGGAPFVFQDPDPNRIDPVELVAAQVTADLSDQPADQDQILADHDARILGPLTRALGNADAAKAAAPKLRSAGMQSAIAQLQALADKGDDVINLGFLRAQTDMYRLRQLLLGGTAASRLATSPALAGIVEAPTATAQEAAIQAAFQDMQASKVPVRVLHTVKFVDMQALMTPQAVAAAPAVPGAAGTPPAASAGTPPATAAGTPAVFAGALSAISTTGLGVTPASALFEAQTTPADAITTPIAGRTDIRSTTTEQRISAAKAPEARDFALASKFAILLSLKNAPSTLDATLYPQAPSMLEQALSNIQVPHVADFENGAFVFLGDQNVKRVILSLKDMDTAAISRTLEEPDDKNMSDESSFFSAATDIIDSAVAILRGAEGRIAAFRDAIGVCQDTLDTLQNALHLFDVRLGTIDDNLTEARQDISVTRALLAEEEQRVSVINQRRERVIREQAEFYAFRRPSTIDLFLPMPSHTVDPEILQLAVPVCLSQQQNSPAELQKLIELLRESPARWFPAIERLIERFDRPQAILDVVTRASARITALGSATLEDDNFLSVSRGRFGDAIQKVLTAQRSSTAQFRYALVNFDTSTFAGLSWSGTRESAGQLLTVGDLIDHSVSRPDVSREAAKMLDQLGRVSACLYGKFAEVAPDIRLDWALRFSQYDGAVDFHNLALLPQWSRIDYLDGHEMQTYADWLFAQADPSDGDALAAFNNIIRVALLLASHAPVDRILQGDLQQAASLQEGGVVPVKFNPAIIDKIRRGLEFNLVRGTDVVGRAVVDDLQGNLANLKLTKNLTDASVLSVDEQVKAIAASSTAAMERRLTAGTPSRVTAALAGLAAPR